MNIANALIESIPQIEEIIEPRPLIEVEEEQAPQPRSTGKSRAPEEEQQASDRRVEGGNFVLLNEERDENANLFFNLAEEQTRGRSLTRERNHSRARSNSPTRIKDTLYEQGTEKATAEIGSWNEARQRLKNGEINDGTIFRTLGAYGIEVVGYTVEEIDAATGGAVTWVGDKVDDSLKWLGTQTRRGVRGVTGDQRLGQNAGDYIYAGLSVLGPKKILGLGKVAKLEKGAEIAKASGKVRNAERKIEALDLASVKPKGVEITLEFIEGMNMRDFSRKTRAFARPTSKGPRSCFKFMDVRKFYKCKIRITTLAANTEFAKSYPYS